MMDEILAFKPKPALRCRKCRTTMSKLNLGDTMGLFSNGSALYCTTEECEWFGVVVMSGLLPDQKEGE